MTVFYSVWLWLMLAAAFALHIASNFLNEKYAKIAVFVNLALHISLIIVLLVIGASLEEAVMVYMISVFLYTLCAYASYKKNELKCKSRCGEEGTEVDL